MNTPRESNPALPTAKCTY